MNQSRIRTSAPREPQDALAAREPSQESPWAEAGVQGPSDRLYEATLTPRLEWTPTASAQENYRQGQRAAILARLKMGPTPTFELMMIGGSGFSSRLAELRREGHRIVAKRIEHHAMYVLGEPPA